MTGLVLEVDDLILDVVGTKVVDEDVLDDTVTVVLFTVELLVRINEDFVDEAVEETEETV